MKISQVQFTQNVKLSPLRDSSSIAITDDKFSIELDEGSSLLKITPLKDSSYTVCVPMTNVVWMTEKVEKVAPAKEKK